MPLAADVLAFLDQNSSLESDAGSRYWKTVNGIRKCRQGGGKSKIGGEAVNLNKYLLRGSIVGPEAAQGKSLLNWFLNQSEGKVNGFIDHMWNGITTLNFAKIVHGMIKLIISKIIYNM